MNAVDLYLDVNGVSDHSQQHEVTRADGSKVAHYNQMNLGFGARAEWLLGESLRAVALAGYYKNSLYRISGYGGVGVEQGVATFPFGLEARAGLLVGGMSGYSSGLDPLLLPSLAVGNAQGAVRLMVAPPVGKVGQTVLMMNLSLRLN